MLSRANSRAAKKNNIKSGKAKAISTVVVPRRRRRATGAVSRNLTAGRCRVVAKGSNVRAIMVAS
jgi:hypothetical protein